MHVTFWHIQAKWKLRKIFKVLLLVYCYYYLLYSLYIHQSCSINKKREISEWGQWKLVIVVKTYWCCFCLLVGFRIWSTWHLMSSCFELSICSSTASASSTAGDSSWSRRSGKWVQICCRVLRWWGRKWEKLPIRGINGNLGEISWTSKDRRDQEKNKK